MTPLTSDVARCPGRVVSAVHGFYTVTIGQVECVRCRRREPHTPATDVPERPLPHMSPPQFVDGRCPQRIAP